METNMLIQLLTIFLSFATKSATSKVKMTNLNNYQNTFARIHQLSSEQDDPNWASQRRMKKMNLGTYEVEMYEKIRKNSVWKGRDQKLIKDKWKVSQGC